MKSFEELQSGLLDAWSANRPGSRRDHVVVVLPSYSFAPTLLAHYERRVPALEQRYLLAVLMLRRIPSCEMVFVCSVAPDPEMVEYYFSLMPDTPDARDRLRIVTVPGSSSRPLAANLLDRHDLIAELSSSFAGRPAFLETWNVREAERRVALALGAPLNGTPAHLWPLGFKSSSRYLFEEVGVPVAPGRADVRSPSEVVASIAAIRAETPALRSVVVKLDDSGAGDGNMVIPVGPDPELADPSPHDIEARVRSLPLWFLEELREGGVVEALIEGPAVTSPSVQVDITPAGETIVIATHEQVLDGEHNQVYNGCRFPANPAYAAELASHGQAVGEELAALGAIGRFSIDFMASLDSYGAWNLHALEINLRKGGTTPPYAVLRHLAPGHYDVESAAWRVAGGGTRAYWSTDNLVDESWVGAAPGAVIRAVDRAGLTFDRHEGTGIVLHMLDGLSIDGRIGMTAVGLTPDHAASLFATAEAEIHRALDRRTPVTALTAGF